MNPDQQFCLRWNNFQSSITSAFESLRDEDEFVDVTIACEGRQIQAHKMVLSACSPYFKSLLKKNPCQHPIIILKDVKYSCLVMLLDFMYHGEVNVANDQLGNFLQTAEALKIRGLAEEEQKRKVPLPKFTDTTSSPDITNHQERMQTPPRPPHSPPAKRKRVEKVERNETTSLPAAITVPPPPVTAPPPPPPPPLPAVPHSPVDHGQSTESVPTNSSSPHIPPEVSHLAHLQVEQVKEEPKDIEVISVPEEVDDSHSPVTVKEQSELELENDEQFRQFASSLQDSYKASLSEMNSSAQSESLPVPTSRSDGELVDPMQGGLPGPSGISLSQDSTFSDTPSGQRKWQIQDHRLPRVLCPICLSSFSRTSIRVHFNTIHQQERPKACKHCGRYFKNSNSLKAHKSRTHRTLVL